MSFDSIVTNSIAYELSSSLLNGRVDKIYQPEKNELILNIRSNNTNYKLLISINPNYPRVHFINDSRDNPSVPPAFCMLLRKHLTSAKVLSIKQIDFDRIIEIEFETLDELEGISSTKIIIEIMGRHSNIILVNKDNIIIDSIVRVSHATSRIREVLPGRRYVSPPAQDKINPFKMDLNKFRELLEPSSSNVQKFLLNTFLGLSPLICREISYRASVEADTLCSSLKQDKIIALFNSFSGLISEVNTHSFVPNIVWNEDESPFVFSAVEITQYHPLNNSYFNTISQTLEVFYRSKALSDRLKQGSEDLYKLIKSKLDKNYKKLSIQSEEYLNSQDREKYRIMADLIMANIHSVQKGDEKVTVQNFYDEDTKDITIPLDSKLNAAKNAQRYYKLYNKLKNASIIVQEQIFNTKNEINYLEGQLTNIENCTTKEDIEEIRLELVETGYLRKRPSKDKIKKQKKALPLHYVSSDGIDIFVGKTNIQNDYLSFKIATHWDLWMHTKDIPGSHVIVKANAEDIPQSTLVEAAILSAFYSKAKDSSNVPVDYTQRKFVKKPSGSKPGFVIYTNQKTIYVTPTPKEVSKIKQVD